MARIYGLNGALRGKQGNNVFSIQNGVQVVKAYQPVVANPRTFLQSVQRAKFALAGKLSSVVPSGAIVGLSGGSQRSRRALFVSTIAQAATTTQTPSSGGVQINAAVAYADILFSQGALPRYSIVSNATATYQGSVGAYALHVTCTGHSTDPISSQAPAGYGELIVACMFDSATSRLDACQYAVRGSDAVAFDFQVGSRPGCHAVLYAVPFAPTDGANSYGAAGNLSGNAADVSLLMQEKNFLAGMKFGTSKMLYDIEVAPVSTLVAPPVEDDNR